MTYIIIKVQNSFHFPECHFIIKMNLCLTKIVLKQNRKKSFFLLFFFILFETFEIL